MYACWVWTVQKFEEKLGSCQFGHWVSQGNADHAQKQDSHLHGTTKTTDNYTKACFTQDASYFSNELWEIRIGH
jgi:hypothetical protein